MTRPILIDLVAQWRRRAIELRSEGNFTAASERDRAADELRAWWDEVTQEAIELLPSRKERTA